MTPKLTTKETFLAAMKETRMAERASGVARLEGLRARKDECEERVKEAVSARDRYVENHPGLDKFNDPDYRGLCANVNYFVSASNSAAHDLDEAERKQRILIERIEAPSSVKKHIATLADCVAKRESISVERDALLKKISDLSEKDISLTEHIKREEATGANAIVSSGKAENQLVVQGLIAEQRMVRTAIDNTREALAGIEKLSASIESEIDQTERTFRMYRSFVAEDEMNAASVEFVAAAAKVASLSGKREFSVRITDDQFNQATEAIRAEILGKSV